MTKSSNDEVREFYNSQVALNPDMPAILGCSSKIIADYRTEYEWKVFQELVNLSPMMNVLELGCGAGRWMGKLSPYVNKVVGCDFSENAINMAKNSPAIKSAQNVSLFCASIEEFMPEGLFDIIYFSAVLLYLNDDEVSAVIEKYKSKLRCNGYFVVRDSIADVAFSKRWTHYTATYRSISCLERLFNKSNFVLQNRRKAVPPIRYSFFWNSHKISKFYKHLKNDKIKKAFLGFMRCMSYRSNISIFQNNINGNKYSHDFIIFTHK